MKTKLEMAHEYLLRFSGTTVAEAWQYADAMQAEADKRENKTRPEALGVVQQTLIDGVEQPRYAPSMGDQKRTPRVSRFERSDAVKEVLSRAENMGLIKPKAIDEWQPDWSQAPDWAGYFTIDSLGIARFWDYEPTKTSASWFIDDDVVWRCEETTIFNYQGDWRESLRKRHK